MPTYEYRCRKCDHEFELVQKMSDEPLKTCPECRGRVKRLIGSGAGIIFKGNGFYCTDYRSDGYRKAAAKDTKSATEKSTGDAKKSKETKTATADASKASS